MRYLLDTNSCIYLLADRHPELTRRVAASDRATLAISAVTFAELILGSSGGKPPMLSTLEQFTGEVPVLPFDVDAARAYARLPFSRGNFDRLLAAHALSLDAAVVTNNERDFADVPGLRVENWTRAS